MTQRVGIIDHHGGDHGGWVTEALKQRFDGQVIDYKVGGGRASFQRLAELLDEAADDADKIVAVNLSFGGGASGDPYAAPEAIDRPVRRLFERGVSVFMSAGNAGREKEGASVLAGHPLVWTIGALTPAGAFADYSQHAPETTHAFANGYLESDGVRGTSFASPRVCGAVAQLRTRLAATDLEARTVLKRMARTISFKDDSLTGGGSRAYTYWELPAPDALARVGDIAITDRVNVVAVYEVFAGRQPSSEEITEGKTVLVDNGTTRGMFRLAKTLREAGDWLNRESPLVPRVQALYHIAYRRDPANAEVLRHIRELEPVMGGPTGSVPQQAWADYVQQFLKDANIAGDLDKVFE